MTYRKIGPIDVLCFTNRSCHSKHSRAPQTPCFGKFASARFPQTIIRFAPAIPDRLSFGVRARDQTHLPRAKARTYLRSKSNRRSPAPAAEPTGKTNKGQQQGQEPRRFPSGISIDYEEAEDSSQASHAARARSHCILWRSFLSRIFFLSSSSRGTSRSKVMFAGWKRLDSAWVM